MYKDTHEMASALPKTKSYQERQAFTEINDEIVLSLDIGTGSIGECMRRGTEIAHLESWVFPAMYGSIADERDRRRAFRTRRAHRNREKYFDYVWAKLGLPVLRQRDPQHPGVQADPRMLRNFPAKGDTTAYHPAIIALKILRGDRNIQDWQWYKAIRHALQLRGYDENVPWANTVEDEKETKDNTENFEGLNAWQLAVKDLPPEQQLPCYYQARVLGAWDPSQPNKLIEDVRPTGNEPYRGQKGRPLVYPRRVTTAQVRLLLERCFAAKGITANIDEILFGPSGDPYPERLAHANDEDEETLNVLRGIFGQRAPRFNNRCISSCTCIPSLQASTRDPKTTKNHSVLEAQLLLQLLNLRFTNADGQSQRLSAGQLAGILKFLHGRKDKWWETTKTDIKNFLKSENLKWKLNADKETTELLKPRIDGRAAFSRVAAAILKELILSGDAPDVFHQKLLARYQVAGVFALTQPFFNTKGEYQSQAKGQMPQLPQGYLFITPSHLDFLLQMGRRDEKGQMVYRWETIHLPDNKIKGIEKLINQRALPPDKAIQRIIGMQKSPRVRLRLQLILDRIDVLCKKSEQHWHRRPDRFVIELPRDKEYTTELGASEKEREKAKRYLEQSLANEAEWIKWDQKREEMKVPASFRNTLKIRRWTEQGGIAAYSGKKISIQDILENRVEIEHIVPHSRCNSDAAVNIVLEFKADNNAKGNSTPYEMWGQDAQVWHRIETLTQASSLPQATKDLILSPAAPELLKKVLRAELSSTAWITKYVVLLLKIKLGVPLTDQSTVVIERGTNTAARRRSLHLSALKEHGEITPWLQTDCKKDRSDQRHHGVDALLASFWNYKQEVLLRNRKLLEAAINKILFRRLIHAKPSFEKTIYGRNANGNFTCRWSADKFGNKKDYTFEKAKTQIERIIDPKLKAELIAAAPSTYAALQGLFRQRNIKRVKIQIGTYVGDKVEMPKGSGNWFRCGDIIATYISKIGGKVVAQSHYLGQPKPSVGPNVLIIRTGDWVDITPGHETMPPGRYRVASIKIKDAKRPDAKAIVLEPINGGKDKQSHIGICLSPYFQPVKLP